MISGWFDCDADHLVAGEDAAVPSAVEGDEKIATIAALLKKL